MSEIKKLFNNKEKFEIVTLEDLKRTNVAWADMQRSKTTPVAHYELIDSLQQILKDAGQEPELDHIYVTNQGGSTALRNIEEQHGEKNILEAWLLRKVTGKIKLPNLMDGESGCAIAFAYHDKGIDVSFGQNVHDCSNMCIFGSNVLHTYGKYQNVNYEKMLSIVNDWAQNAEQLRKNDLALIQSMKMITVTSEQMLQFTGKLLVLANAVNMGKKAVAPLNVTSVSEVVRGLLKDNEEVFRSGNTLTLWQFYNYMTAIMKADHNQDITTLLTDIVNLGNMMVHEFSVQPTIDIVDLSGEDEFPENQQQLPETTEQ